MLPLDICCLSISLLPLDISTASRSSSGAISPFSSFIGRTPESFLKDFPFRFSILPKVSRLRHLKSRDSCYLSLSLRPRGLRQAPYLHFHQSPALKSPERLFFPIQRTPESFLTTPPEISRFPFGTKVIKILDLSPYLPPTRPFAVSPTLSYSTKPVFPIPQNQSFTNHATRQNPLLSFINLLARSILISPCLTTTLISPFITSYNYQVRFPDRSLRIVILPIPQNQSFTNHATRQNPLLSFINLLARLSSFHPVLQQHSSVQFITSYNYQVRFPDRPIRIVILPIPQNQSFTNHATRQNPLLSFINSLPRSILISPCLTTTLISPFITSYNYKVRFPDRSIRIVIHQTGNSQLATHGIARNLKRSAPM